MFGLGKLVEFVGNFLNSEEGQKAVKERVSGWMGFGTADEEIFRTILTALENLHGTAGPIYRKAIEELLAKLNEDQRKRFRIIITSFVLPEVRPTTTFEPTIMRNPDGTPIVEKGKIKIEQKKTEGVLNRIAGTEKDPRIQCLISIAKDWIDCKNRHSGEGHSGQCAINSLKLIGWVLKKPAYVEAWSKAKGGFIKVMKFAQAELLAANGVKTLAELEKKIQEDRNTIRADHARDKRSLLNNPATWAMVVVIIVLLLSAKLF